MRGHGFTTRNGWFIDPQGRHAILRGVNLGGSSKVPLAPNGATHLGADTQGWADVSFIGRPFPIEEAARHLDRLAHWGFNVLRLLTTWEAIEHAGPGRYDEAYLEYFREVVKLAGERGLLVFIDPHHDVWSRWTGGDGAPFWCFEQAGLLAQRFVEAEAVRLHAHDWPQAYDRAPVASMWTLFYGGDTFARTPELAGIQSRLQESYINAVAALAERLAGLDNVLGYDTLNEPGRGYIGRGDDLLRAGHVFSPAGAPGQFSPLQYMAAADGHAVQNELGETLNPQSVSIWRQGCPWRRAGVWELDRAGQPVLLKPDFFRDVDGRLVGDWSDFMVPFIHRFRERLRAVDPGCFMFIEGWPMGGVTPWTDDDPRTCNAGHWYDLGILGRRVFDPAAFSPRRGVTLSGREQIGGYWTEQLGRIKTFTQQHMQNVPLLIGETGIVFDMNGGESYHNGDYSKQEAALDALYLALDNLLINSTQWNYTADNDHTHGDQWNNEDLSIFSLDDQEDPQDLDSGARGLRGFCRPFVERAAGRPRRMAFDLESARFELEIESEPASGAPTLVYVPRLQYPDGVRATVSSGEVEHDAAAQSLRWSGHTGNAVLRLERR